MNACEKPCVGAWRGNKHRELICESASMSTASRCLSGTVSARTRRRFGAGSAHGMATRRLRKVATAWQAQHLRKVRYRWRGRRRVLYRFRGYIFCSRRSACARSSTVCLACAALSSQVQIVWQARTTCASSGTDGPASAALSQGR